MKSVGKAFLIFIFLIIASALSENSCQKEDAFPRPAKILIQFSDNAIAIVSDGIRLPSYEKNWISSVDKLNLRFSVENSKIIIDNNKTCRIINTLQKYEQLIKPLIICRFYHCLYRPNKPEQPFLS